MNDNIREKEKGFYKSSVIYFVGSALSKVINILILPYISIFLSPELYGIYDLIQTMSALLVPIFTFQLIEAAYRFVFKAKQDELYSVISNVIVALLVLSVVFSCITILVGAIAYSAEYTVYIVLYYWGTMLMNLYQRVARSVGCSKEFAISGVLQTFMLLGLQLAFLRFTNLKLEGLIIAYCISTVFVAVYLERKINLCNYFKLSYIRVQTIKQYAIFSLPLVPNSILWWGTSSLNRLIIVAILGYDANGIYSMSNKFSSIIIMISSVVVMAWQELCIREEKNPEREGLYTKTTNTYTIIIFYATACVTLIQKIYFERFIDISYHDAINYIPIIMYGVAFSAMSSFWGAGYMAHQKTMESFKSTAVGAIVNVIFCILGAQVFGLYGVATGSMLGYVFIWIFRTITMKEYFKLKIDKFSWIQVAAILILTSVIYYIASDIICVIVAILFFCIYILVDGKNTFKLIFESVKR